MKLTNSFSSLTNMLGEFVAIQKTPEFKPCSVSMQELDRAVKEEKKSYSLKHREQHGGRPRFLSVGNVGEEVSSNPAGGVVRRSSAGVRRRERPTSLIEFVKQRMSPSRRNEVITEEEEEAQQLGRKQSIRSTQSERLQIQIV
ncbi:hypothetical protein OESDEN_22665 [Oesophagostomum dentatum]|uniref:Uncharacterized protein n=1 Tax=Oesophagostomum dentatum TaxID=61180 RepID=A0A0B1S3E3_OESDE|nr:hypothetical protein OESDEN_22665 [Oesophagostomum dentatum]